MSEATPNRIVGLNIRLLREKLGLTQEMLAGFLETSREQIAYYEAGTRSIPTAQLSKLANLFCLNEYDFYEENSGQSEMNMAFAFRADTLNTGDLAGIARFKKIVRNYVNMVNAVSNE